MIVARSPKRAFELCVLEKKKGRTVGLVPTMGDLHDGHISLIRKCRKKCDFLTVSIFVNPAQFSPREDFKNYPRNLRRDSEICRKSGVDLLFNPSAKDVYPEGFETYVNLEKIPNHLCGLKRPGHFRGVATVVLKLFNIIQPDVAVFGKKDYQQLKLIKKMARDLNVPVKIIAGETVRSSKGLALSSRNRYLSLDDSERALFLRKSLLLGRRLVYSGSAPDAVKEKMRHIIKKSGGKIDYISVCDRDSFEELKKIEKDALIAVAVKVGPARLIDNIEVRKK